VRGTGGVFGVSGPGLRGRDSLRLLGGDGRRLDGGGVGIADGGEGVGQALEAGK